MNTDILDNIRNDRNYYSAEKLKDFCTRRVIRGDELSGVFNQIETNAILNWNEDDPFKGADQSPEALAYPSTEFFFWGTPNSGKTCALGALLSAMKYYGIVQPLKCQGAIYRDQLSDLFRNNGICTLPPATANNCIQEMRVAITDKWKKIHEVTLVDLAGEVFRALYAKENGADVPEDCKDALDKVLKYVKSEENKKVHFFIVPYGEEDRRWKNISISTYLKTAMKYLADNNVLKNNTNGIYVLVTKCDAMKYQPQNWCEQARQYVEESYGEFSRDLTRVCKTAGVKDLQIIPFSIGDVFAKQLCHFNEDYTDRVINKLILKSRAKKVGLGERFAEWFRE